MGDYTADLHMEINRLRAIIEIQDRQLILLRGFLDEVKAVITKGGSYEAERTLVE